MGKARVRSILLPRLVLVADGFVSGRTSMPAEEVRARVVQAVQAGVAWVQLRDYGSEGDEFRDAALPFAEHLRSIHPSILLSVSRRHDLAQGMAIGVHTGAGGPTPDEARDAAGPLMPIGYSAHSPEEAEEAAHRSNYIFFGPVYSTTTHFDRTPVGLEALAEACRRAVPRPVYAIGGITPERADEVHAADAYGAAVLGGILDAEDVGATVAAYLQALRPQSPTLDRPLHA